jgi:hypothetical protein
MRYSILLFFVCKGTNLWCQLQGEIQTEYNQRYLFGDLTELEIHGSSNTELYCEDFYSYDVTTAKCCDEQTITCEQERLFDKAFESLLGPGGLARIKYIYVDSVINSDNYGFAGYAFSCALLVNDSLPYCFNAFFDSSFICLNKDYVPSCFSNKEFNLITPFQVFRTVREQLVPGDYNDFYIDLHYHEKKHYFYYEFSWQKKSRNLLGFIYIYSRIKHREVNAHTGKIIKRLGKKQKKHRKKFRPMITGSF